MPHDEFSRVYNPVYPGVRGAKTGERNVGDRWARAKDLDWDFLNDLSNLFYWGRAWTRQEILLARQVCVLYRQFELFAHTLQALVDHSNPGATPADECGFLTSRFRSLCGRRKSRQYTHGTFSDLLLDNTKCTIARDRVYAVRSPASNGTDLVVSYKESLVDLYP